MGGYSSAAMPHPMRHSLRPLMAMRVAGQTVERSGYYSDGGSDQNDKAVRVSFLAEPSANLSLYLTADYAKTDSHGLGTTLQQACGTSFCYIGSEWTGLGDLMQYLPQERPESYNDSYFWGITGNVEWTTDYAAAVPVLPAPSAPLSPTREFGSLLVLTTLQRARSKLPGPQYRRLSNTSL